MVKLTKTISVKEWNTVIRMVRNQQVQIDLLRKAQEDVPHRLKEIEAIQEHLCKS